MELVERSNADRVVASWSSSCSSPTNFVGLHDDARLQALFSRLMDGHRDTDERLFELSDRLSYDCCLAKSSPSGVLAADASAQ